MNERSSRVNCKLIEYATFEPEDRQIVIIQFVCTLYVILFFFSSSHFSLSISFGFFFMCEIILSPSILQLAMAECRKVLASALSVAQLISVRSALNACDSDGGRDG